MTVIDARDAHSDEGRDGHAYFSRVDVGSIAGNDACVLELSNAFDHRRSGQAHAAAKLGVAQPGVRLKFINYASVDLVGHGWCTTVTECATYQFAPEQIRQNKL